MSNINIKRNRTFEFDSKMHVFAWAIVRVNALILVPMWVVLWLRQKYREREKVRLREREREKERESGKTYKWERERDQIRLREGRKELELTIRGREGGRERNQK